MDKTTGRSKVGRVIREYNLGGIGDKLERRWIGQNGQRQSLRELADFLNKRILEQAFKQADQMLIDGEIENLYRLLSDNDVRASQRAQAEQKLARAGIDVGSLQQNFVSHQAVHTYLTDFRGVELDSTEESSSDTVNNRRESIQKLRNRLVTVSESNITALREANQVSVGPFDVTVSVTIHCRDCHETYALSEFFNRERCACDNGDESAGD
jgi:hypothetical protein